LTNNKFKEFSNILMIDDEWICRQGMSLYQFISCTDILITDYSSVLIDYLLLEQPVICFSTDLDSYKNTQGLNFENIEDWIPTKFVHNQKEFFMFLRNILLSGEDPYIEKRIAIRNKFFTFNDANSTQRLIEHVFGDKVKKCQDC